MKTILFMLFALTATPALAHDGVFADQSLASGFAHPFAGPDHLFAMLAVGIVGSRFCGWTRLAVPVAFLAAMMAGYVLALAGMALPAVEAAILVSVIGFAALCILPTGLVTACLAAAAFAVFHGHAHGIEAGSGSAFGFGLGFTTASAALMGVGMALGLATGRTVRSHPKSRTDIGLPT